MAQYNSLINILIRKEITKRANIFQIRKFSRNFSLGAAAKSNDVSCCLPYLPQCPPAIPDCEPCPPCPPCPPKQGNPFLQTLLVNLLKALILGATIYWTYTEGVWSHPKITDRTFRRWYGQVFGAPTPEACICDEKKHIPTHEEINYRVTQTYYGLTAGTFKGLMAVFPKGNLERPKDCKDTALCKK